MIHPTGSDLRRPGVLFLCATLAALAIRTVYILQMANPAVNPFFAHPILDAAVHRHWALGILSGTWPPAEPFFRAPLYPYFLALLYRIFGPENGIAVQLVHGLVSALGAGLAGLCARQVWGNRAGWFAGLGFAAMWPSIFFAGELLDVSLGVTLNLLLWWLLLGKTTNSRLVGAGLVWGLSIISRPLVLAIAPVVIVYLYRRGVRTRGWILVAGGLAVAVLPVTTRNLVKGGEPVLVAASGGVNFFIGNNQYADGRVAFLPGAAMDWQGEMSEVMALAAKETGQAQSALSADRYFLGKGLSFIKDNPGQAMSLYLRKLGLLFAAGERSNNKNIPFWRARSPLLQWPLWVGWGPVFVLAFLGLRRRELDPDQCLLMWGSLLLYASALLLFFINARFRLPLLGWLLVPAGAGADRLVRAVRLGDWNPRFRWAVAMAVVALLVISIPDKVDLRRHPVSDFENWRILGNGFEQEGDFQRAGDSYRMALEIDQKTPRPEYKRLVPAVYMRLGGILLRQGRWRSAENAFTGVIRRAPGSWEAYGNLAICYEQTGRSAEAQAAWQKLLDLNPNDKIARQRLGR